MGFKINLDDLSTMPSNKGNIVVNRPFIPSIKTVDEEYDERKAFIKNAKSGILSTAKAIQTAEMDSSISTIEIAKRHGLDADGNLIKSPIAEASNPDEAIKDTLAKLVKLYDADKVLSPKALERVVKKAATEGVDVPTAISAWADEVRETFANRDERAPSVQRLDEITEKPSTYLWAPYIGMGELTTLVADGGVGKGTLCNYLLYLASTGQFGKLGKTNVHKPIQCLYSSIEDDPAKKALPQIKLYGGDLSKVSVCKGFANRETFNIGDINGMRRIIEAVKPEFWILDNAGDLGSAENDGNNYKSVSRELMNLSILAEEYQCAILLLVHTNRAGSFMGSNAYRTKPRSMLLLKKTQDDNQTVLLHKKSNDYYGPSVIFDATPVVVPSNDYPVWQVSFGGLASPSTVAFAEDKLIKSKQKILENWLFHLLETTGVQTMKSIRKHAHIEFSEQADFQKNGEYVISSMEWKRAKENLKLQETSFGLSLKPLVREAMSAEALSDDGDDDSDDESDE